MFQSSPVCLSLCEGMLSLLDFSKNGRKNSVISCFLQNSFLCLYTVLLYRLTGKLINYYRKPSKLHIVQWRATPSGSFREPVDYKGQEPSNLVFSEFRRSTLTAKLFLYTYTTTACHGKPSLYMCMVMISFLLAQFERLLCYIPLVECLLIAAGVGVVFAKCSGKVMCAGEVFFCAHVQVVVLLVVQYAF